MRIKFLLQCTAAFLLVFTIGKGIVGIDAFIEHQKQQSKVSSARIINKGWAFSAD